MHAATAAAFFDELIKIAQTQKEWAEAVAKRHAAFKPASVGYTRKVAPKLAPAAKKLGLVARLLGRG